MSITVEDLELNIIQYTNFLIFLDETKIDLTEYDFEYSVYNYEVPEFSHVDKSAWPSWCKMWL